MPDLRLSTNHEWLCIEIYFSADAVNERIPPVNCTIKFSTARNYVRQQTPLVLPYNFGI